MTFLSKFSFYKTENVINIINDNWLIFISGHFPSGFEFIKQIPDIFNQRLRLSMFNQLMAYFELLK